MDLQDPVPALIDEAQAAGGTARLSLAVDEATGRPEGLRGGVYTCITLGYMLTEQLYTGERVNEIDLGYRLIILINKKYAALCTSALAGLLLLSMALTAPVSASDNPYGVQFKEISEDGMTWYYTITYNKDKGPNPPDISHLELVFKCNDAPLKVWISEAGGDCLKAVETDCDGVLPCNTTSIKWEFNSDCIELNFGDEGLREMEVWFRTYPYVYDNPGPLFSATTFPAGSDNLVLLGPFCGSFFEIPELPYGTLAAVLAPMAALYAVSSRRRTS